MQIRPANPTPGPVNILSKAATAAHTNRGQTDAEPPAPRGWLLTPRFITSWQLAQTCVPTQLPVITLTQGRKGRYAGFWSCGRTGAVIYTHLAPCMDKEFNERRIDNRQLRQRGGQPNP